MKRWLSSLCRKKSRIPRRTRKRSHPEESIDSTQPSDRIAGESTANPDTKGGVERTKMMTKSQANPINNIIVNHDFSQGMYCWHPNCCDAYVVSEETGFPNGVTAKSGISYVVVTKRNETWQGLEQDITGTVTIGVKYTLSTFVRVYGDDLTGTTGVQATLRLENADSSTSYLSLGRIPVSNECWEKLEGTFSLESIPKKVVLYLEGPSPGVDLLIDSVIVSSSRDNQFEESVKAVNSQTTHTNIILNHDFSEGLHHWHPNSCHAFVASEKTGFLQDITAKTGESYAVVTERTEYWQGLEHDITGRVNLGIAYKVKSYVRVCGDLQGSSEVKATLRFEYPDSSTNYLLVGRVFVSKESWEKVTGSFTLTNMPKRIVFFLEGPPPGVDLLIDSVSISSRFKKLEKSVMAFNSQTTPTNIILNRDFSEGLHHWHPNSCHAFVASEKTGFLQDIIAKTRESYAVVTERTEYWQGLEQDITGRVDLGTTYTLKSYVRVFGDFQGSTEVKATLKLEYPDSSTNYLLVGRVFVSKESWEKVIGSFTLTTMPKRIVFFLEGPPPGVDLLIDSVSISSRFKKFEELSASCITSRDEHVIWNPCFEDGLNNWSGRGCEIVLHNVRDNKILPLNGNFFAAATGRSQIWNGIQQEITGRVHRKIVYEVIALVRIFGDVGSAEVRASLWIQAPNGREQYIGIAKVQASDKEWVKLHGKFLLNGSAAKAVVYLEGPPPGIDILVNSLEVIRARKHLHSTTSHLKDVLFGTNIIENSSLHDGLNMWDPLGSCSLRICTGSPRLLPPTARDSLVDHDPLSGRYIRATNRTEAWMGPSQTITDRLRLHVTYQVAAWVRVGSGASGDQIINVALGVDDQWLNGGQVKAADDRWYEVGGSFRIEKPPSKVIAYVQGPSPGVDLMVAGLHIFPVDRKARFEHLKEKTDKVRKRDVVLQFTGIDYDNMPGVYVKVRQIQNSFPFGSCINRSSLENEDFVDFFVKNFNWAVFDNELKWYHTEPQQGNHNFVDADEMLDFCERHAIQTRGHCIFWEVVDAIQPWIQSLNREELMEAVQSRLRNLLSRYKGRFRHYDVNNEMLHGSFFQDRLGKDILAYMFSEAHKLDPSAILFVNDYNVEDGCDAKSSPEMYIQQILDLQEQGAPVGGIGLQGHISHPVGAVVCSALDKLAILGLPIWFTELDVAAVNEHVRADDLEVMLREAYAHPVVEGIMLWGFWELAMCRNPSHLVEADGNICEAGKRYLALKQEWLSEADGDVNDRGEFMFRGYQGTYSLEITTREKKLSQTFIVDKGESRLILNIDL